MTIPKPRTGCSGNMTSVPPHPSWLKACRRWPTALPIIRARLPRQRAVGWDARLDTWLTTYCHAEDTPYTRAVGAKTLISAVARVEEPGCKADCVPIARGSKGTLKSTVWRVLAAEAWFSDTMPDIDTKDAMQALQGKWIVELGELAVLATECHRSHQALYLHHPPTTIVPPMAGIRGAFHAITSLSPRRIRRLFQR